MSKPSIVLVHGFWGGAAHWAKVIVELDQRGYGSLRAVGNPLAQIGDWRAAQAAAAGNVVPDSDGYVWIKQDKFRESFCQDLPADEALVMAVTQKAPVGSTFGDTRPRPHSPSTGTRESVG
jgi:pimeloyl-ACP methyl ester carboxylesterase